MTGFESYVKKRSIAEIDRRLVHAFREIANMADRGHIPAVIVEHAKYLFQKIFQMDSVKLRSTGELASACLYMACRQEMCPRTFKEMAAISNTSKKAIGRCYKLAVRSVPLTMEMITSTDFISRFCAKLGEFLLRI